MSLKLLHLIRRENMNTRRLAETFGFYKPVSQSANELEKPSTMDHIYISLKKFKQSLSTHSLADRDRFELGPIWTPPFKSLYEGSFTMYENLYRDATLVLENLDNNQEINEAEIFAESFLDFIDQAKHSEDTAVLEALENNASFFEAFCKFQQALINLREINNFFIKPFQPQHVPKEQYKPLELLRDNYEKETGKLLNKFRTHMQFIDKILTSYKVHAEKDGASKQLSLRR